MRRAAARRRERVLRLLVVLAVALLGGLGPPRVTAAEWTAPPADPLYQFEDGGELRIDLWFGWSSTCPHCQRARPVVDAMARELAWLDVHSLQVDGPDGQASVATILALAVRSARTCGP